MKSKNKKESSTKFQDTKVDRDFKKLMNRMGVKKLKNQTDPTSPPPKNEKVDSISFDNDWTAKEQKIGEKGKYTQLHKISEPVQRKRKKITPGFVPDVELDLHGSTREEAVQMIEKLLERCRKKKCKTALIITGRGLNSGKEGGVLRKVAWKWLTKNQGSLHISCRWAPIFLGGNGAILVFFN